MSDLGGEGKRSPPACLNGWFYAIVKLDGDTGTCCRIHQMRLGNLDKGSLKQIWLSKHMMNVRLLGKYGHVQKMFKACQTCPSYDNNIKRAKALAELEENEQAIA